MTLQDQIKNRLLSVLPSSRITLQNIKISSPEEAFLIFEIPRDSVQEIDLWKQKIEGSLQDLPGLRKVHISFTHQRSSSPSKKRLPGVTHIVAVASGKGGVGKSTTAVNLAFALHQQGLKIGILDADIYGPSLPRLLGTKEKPSSQEGNLISPLRIHGLKALSMGFLTDHEGPAIWRGPMIQKAFHHLVHNVAWGPLDILIIDLPPGTGDIHLSFAQTLDVSGVLILSTPQELALTDARKGLEMFQKMDVPILGLIENMSYFLCPHCTARTEIFDHGHVSQEAQKLSLPLLAEIPLQVSICRAAEEGMPFGLKHPDSLEASLYATLAERVWHALSLAPSR